MGSDYQAGRQIAQYQAGSNSLKIGTTTTAATRNTRTSARNEWSSINIVQPKSRVSCDGALDPVPTRERNPASLTTDYSC